MEVDAELPTLSPRALPFDLDAGLQPAGEALLGGGGMDLDRTVRLLWLAALLRLGGQTLEVAGGEPVAHGAVGEPDLRLRILNGEQRAGLAGGAPPSRAPGEA